VDAGTSATLQCFPNGRWQIQTEGVIGDKLPTKDVCKMIEKEAVEILAHMGEKFGVPDIAQEAAWEFPNYVGNRDAMVVAWEIFLDLLEMYEATEKAFSNGIHKAGFVPFLIDRLRLEDAEDVSQIALLSAWRSFQSFRPRSPTSWNAWLLMIAQRKLNTFLEELYRDVELYVDANPEDFECIGNNVIEDEDEEDERYEVIRAVAERWICGEHEGRAIFAARILAICNSEDDYIGLSGVHMEREVGVSRTTLSKWTKQFIGEVYESQG
jgi:hypothetical protein